MTLDTPATGDGGRFADGSTSGTAVVDSTPPSAPNRLIDGLPLPEVMGSASALEPERPALPLDVDQLDRLCSLFKLLSDKTRLSIVQLLCGGEMNVTGLCRKLKLPQPTVSHHLGLLRMNRLIANRRDGKEVFYKLHERIEPATAALRLGGSGGGIQIADGGFDLQVFGHRSSTRSAIYPRTDKR